MRHRTLSALALSLLAGLIPAGAGNAQETAATTGRFLPVFSEPTISGQPSAEKCRTKADGTKDCKPTAGAITVLRDGRLLYWNALEGTENIQNGIALEFGNVAVNDQSRVLTLGPDGPSWAVPTPKDGGAKNNDPEPTPIPGTKAENGAADAALFCTSLVQLPDGRVFVVGGTDYYAEPGVPGTPYGVVELEGTKAARLFDPATNTWSQAASMEYGRWYPTAVTLADGDVFVASGVTKLMKPVYADRPADSGSNVMQTETYDVATDKWTTNPTTANKSLPLYPRLHLLPNGDVFYNAAGQVYNPQGQSYDQALWNVASTYNPVTKRWTDLGIPGIGTSHPGFRGSTFSIMLPLQPDALGRYRQARFLSAGGIFGVTPGAYIASNQSAITTVDVTGDTPTMTTTETGPLNARRWYSSGVQLPDGSVLAVSGADRDEVVAPGSGAAVRTVERFDPKTGKWTVLNTATQERTYHNTATLLPDGRVMLGGHAPISAGYGKNGTVVPGVTSDNDGRNPTFEIYEPPYLHTGLARPEILGAPQTARNSQQITFTLRSDAPLDSVALVRKTSATHLVDADQRTVILPVVKQQGSSVTVQLPGSSVAPPGPYMLFANAATAKGVVPSVSAPLDLRA